MNKENTKFCFDDHRKNKQRRVEISFKNDDNEELILPFVDVITLVIYRKEEK